MQTPYMLSANSVSVTVGSDLKVFAKGTVEYDKVVEFIRANDDKGLVKYLTEFEQKTTKRSNGVFRVENGVIFVTNEDGSETVAPRVFGERLKMFFEEKLPFEPLIEFWKRINKNRSKKVFDRLFECLDINHHPILTDGRFLAWRKVRRHDDEHLYDIHTGKVLNDVGEKPRMPHNQVDENEDVTCSKGYHGSSWEYAKYHYGTPDDVMVEIAIDPEDVVAVPRDYNSQKMRICAYEVLREVELKREDKLSKVYDDEPDYDKDLDEENDDLDCCSECGESDCCGECSDEEEICDSCGESLDWCECEDE